MTSAEDKPDPIRVGAMMDGKAGQIGRTIEGIAKEELVKTTRRFGKRTKIGGMSFVVLGVRLWTDELCELNAVATADYLRALADLAEARTHEQKLNAERRRQDAVNVLFKSLHHEMEQPK